jgi:hypothetical protein
MIPCQYHDVLFDLKTMSQQQIGKPFLKANCKRESILCSEHFLCFREKGYPCIVEDDGAVDGKTMYPCGAWRIWGRGQERFDRITLLEQQKRLRTKPIDGGMPVKVAVDEGCLFKKG